MKVTCAYCGCSLPEKEPLDSDELSHGICEQCLSEYALRWAGTTMDDYLAQFDVPVLVVDRDARVLGINPSMKALLPDQTEDPRGRLSGEVVECTHSKLPGGCGGTVHCVACSLRGAVRRAYANETGEVSVPVYVDREDGRVFLTMSTHYDRGSVRIEIGGITGDGP